MTVKITEVTREDRATFGMRMQRIREALGLTRNEVSEQTGIPVRSIEKFEQGVMSPNVERLQALAQVLEVSVGHLLDGDEDAEAPAATQSAPESPAKPVLTEEEPEDVIEKLARLDGMRAEGFQRYWRKAPRLFDEAETLLSRMDYDELLDTAEERGVMAVPSGEIEGFYEMEPDAQAEHVEELTERIQDTAYFGLDLYRIETDHLDDLSEKLDLEKDEKGWFSDTWSSEVVLVQVLRPVLREQFLAGNTLDFLNDDQFPKKEAA